MLFSLLVNKLHSQLHEDGVSDSEDVAFGKLVRNRAGTSVLGHKLIEQQFAETLMEPVNRKGRGLHQKLKQVLEGHFVRRVEIQRQAIVVGID